MQPQPQGRSRAPCPSRDSVRDPGHEVHTGQSRTAGGMAPVPSPAWAAAPATCSPRGGSLQRVTRGAGRASPSGATGLDPAPRPGLLPPHSHICVFLAVGQQRARRKEGRRVPPTLAGHTPRERGSRSHGSRQRQPVRRGGRRAGGAQGAAGLRSGPGVWAFPRCQDGWLCVRLGLGERAPCVTVRCAVGRCRPGQPTAWPPVARCLVCSTPGVRMRWAQTRPRGPSGVVQERPEQGPESWGRQRCGAAVGTALAPPQMESRGARSAQ